MSYDTLLFEPGVVYVIYGERSQEDYAYKIGMTRISAEHRIKDTQSRWRGWWHFSQNLRVIHQITVDNMRVVETMFHQRYADRMIFPDQYKHSEWFSISDKVAGLRTCKAIAVNHALQALAEDPRDWWTGMDIKERRAVALSLWKHPALEISWNVPL
jgi:hypothetical protein